MKMRKMCVFLLMVTIFVSLLASCGNNQDVADGGDGGDVQAETTDDADDAATNDDADDSAATADDGAVAPAGESIVIRVGRIFPPDMRFPEGQDLDNNAWTELYYERLGVTIVNEILAPADQYNQRIALAIAAGDMPDMWRSDLRNLYLAAEAGLLLDQTGMRYTYLNELSRSFVDAYDIPFYTATIGGVLYGFPFLQEDPGNGASFTFIRNDWLNDLGLDIPQTQSELVEALIAFGEQGPEYFGLAVVNDLWGGLYTLEGFFNAYHAYPNIWFEGDDGSLVYGTVQAEPMMAALRDLNRLYEAGAIDPEFIVKNQSMVAEDVTSLRMGAFFGRWWAPATAPRASFENDPDSVPDRWFAIDPVSIDNQPVLLQSDSSIPEWFYVINSSFERPDLMYEMINLWFEKLYSPDGDEAQFRRYVQSEGDYNDPQGFPFIQGLWPFIQPRVDQLGAAMRGEMTVDQMSGEAAAIFEAMQRFEEGSTDGSDFVNFWAHGQHTHGSMRIRLDALERNGIINDMNFGPATETMIARQSTLDQLRDEVIIQIITGQRSVESFEDFINDWHQLGGQDIINEINEWFDSVR